MLWWLKRFFCNPVFKWIGLALIGIGVILLLIFVPIQFWLAILGLLLIILGILILSI